MGLTSSSSVSDDIIEGIIGREVSLRPPRVFSLDGNIGAGKTTLLTHISKAFPDVLIVPEPVDTWTRLKDEDGRNLLELFYEDKKRWAYTFQNAAILSRLKLLKDILATARPGQIIVTERSVLTDRCVFAKMLKDTGILDSLEWDLYEMWYKTFATDIPMAGILYVTTDVSTSAQRIKTRNRHGEESISTDYLTDLNRYHEAWLSSANIPVLRVSTDTPLHETMVYIGDFFTRTSFPSL